MVFKVENDSETWGMCLCIVPIKLEDSSINEEQESTCMCRIGNSKFDAYVF